MSLLLYNNSCGTYLLTELVCTYKVCIIRSWPIILFYVTGLRPSSQPHLWLSWLRGSGTNHRLHLWAWWQSVTATLKRTLSLVVLQIILLMIFRKLCNCFEVNYCDVTLIAVDKINYVLCVVCACSVRMCVNSRSQTNVILDLLYTVPSFQRNETEMHYKWWWHALFIFLNKATRVYI